MSKKALRYRFRSGGIQAKISFILILTATIILAGFAFFNYFTTKSEMSRDLKRLADFIASQQSESLARPLWNVEYNDVEDIIRSVMNEKKVYAVLVKVKDEKTLSYGVRRDDQWNIIRTGDNISGDYCVRTREIVKSNARLGTVEIYLTYRFMREALSDSLVSIVVTVMVLNISLFLILFVSIRKSVILPLRHFAGSVRIIASGDLDKEVHSGREDEIGQLASDVDKMRLAIKDMTENMKEQERLKKEMELARRIQASLLPALTDGFHPDFQIAATMVPAERVGGDFYDISYDRKGNLRFAIGDVSGHGVTPGLIMMMAQTAHTTVTTNIDCEARDAVVMTNDILYKNVHERLKESHFMTFTALKYLGGGQFQHAGAHLSLIVYRQKTGVCELVRTRGVYLNFRKDISKATRNAEFSLEPGDILILYTDGLTEAENPDGRMLDLDGFVKTVEKHAHHEPEAMKEMIMADVIRWCDDNRADDMTLLIIKRRTEH